MANSARGADGDSGTRASARPRRGRPAVGRDRPLEREEILTCAYRILSADGIDALSMRRLAKDLGVTPMAIYHHVPSKPALLQALIENVWASVFDGVETEPDDLLEWTIGLLLRTRRVWLENIELAGLAMAIAEADEALIESAALAVTVFGAIGFPDVPLAFHALQTFTLGSVATAANRRASTAYFGRDAQAILAQAHGMLRARRAPADQVGVVEARFDAGDEAHFERGLRALVAGLLAANP